MPGLYSFYFQKDGNIFEELKETPYKRTREFIQRAPDVKGEKDGSRGFTVDDDDTGSGGS